MPQSRWRRGEVKQSAIAACLVALVSAVNIGFNTLWSAPPRFDGAGYAVLANYCCAEKVTGPLTIPIDPDTRIFRLVIPCFWL